MDLEPQIASASTHLAQPLGSIIHVDLPDFILRLSARGQVGCHRFKAGFPDSRPEENENMCFSLNDLKTNKQTTKKSHRVLLTLDLVRVLALSEAWRMQCTDWLRPSHAHPRRRGWNQLPWKASGLVVQARATTERSTGTPSPEER